LVLGCNGMALNVVQIWNEKAPLNKSFNTYNFEVADWHTYFVQMGENTILVHNSCSGESRKCGRFCKVQR
jgi:hypothetical protein